MHDNDPSKLKSCDSTKEYSKFRKLLLSRTEPVRHLVCGSFYEMPLLYFASNPTDSDVMFCDMTLCAIYNHINEPARGKTNVLIIDATDCPVGYVRLRNGAEYFRKPYDFDKGPACTKQIPIHDAHLRSLLGKINTRWLDIFMLTEDIVYAIPCPLWPPAAHKWIVRERLNGWPTENIVKAIVEGGCHLVSKPHAKSPNDVTQWRYSFSQAETILIHSWTDVQKYIYHLLRIIKREVVSKCGDDTKTFMCSYYLKTLMLWACEEKPLEFWEDRNILTSVKELLDDLIVKLVDRNVPHYFMPENNIMNVVDTDIEIRLLLCYREKEISEIMCAEPKAYQLTPCYLFATNESLYPVVTTLSRNMITDRSIQKSSILCNCGKSYNCFYPELEYLHNGIVVQLQLSKLNYKNPVHRQDLITSAKGFFDLSIDKFDYGLTRVRINLVWSVYEVCQAFWLSCRDTHFQDKSLMPHSGSRAPRTISTSCYVRDRDLYIRSLRCSFSQTKTEAGIFRILQEILLSQMTIPINPTFIVCSAYRANFFYNALCDYRNALDLCKEVNAILHCASVQLTCISSLFGSLIQFPLINEWCGIYDKYIQIIFGF